MQAKKRTYGYEADVATREGIDCQFDGSSSVQEHQPNFETAPRKK